MNVVTSKAAKQFWFL